MKISYVTVGDYQTNCYVLEEKGHYLIIDPGSRYKKILTLLPEEGAVVDGILLTHGHLDHIGAVDKLVSLFHCPVYISEADMEMARNPRLNLSEYDPVVVNSKMTKIKEGRSHIGNFTVDTYETPGHTQGSLVFVIGNAMFSGDTLFHLSVGRTDLPTGSNSELRNSLKLLKNLDDSLEVYPGHDEITTLGFEKENNPFLIY